MYSIDSLWTKRWNEIRKKVDLNLNVIYGNTDLVWLED
jgi:hypothetical protein